MSPTDLEHVEPHAWRDDTFALDTEVSRPHEENIVVTDYYEILRVGPQVDQDTIERVYRTLADRFHPDNESTGDATTFLRLGEAYETLSNPARRAQYNVSRRHDRGSGRFWLRGRDFFDGVSGGQRRRLAILCLLYRRRIGNYESPGLTILDLERMTGCTREEVTSALWYLCEKKWGTLGDSTAYSITAEGFDVVESKVEDRLELRTLATLCYSGLPTEREGPAHAGTSFPKKEKVPLDIVSFMALEGEAFLADHYESLGIGPQADEEGIERVYRTLAERFHPNNPGTGDTKTFLRVREAYDTLSNPSRRATYDVLRQHTRYSTRFRLRGRECFDGIQGEQLRRLAVLCLLYRQSVSDSPGVTVLDMEHLTGCTREELGCALWYLREKGWAKFGEYTEYSIAAAGFDIVESAALPAAQSQQLALVTPQSAIPNAVAPENPASPRIAESEHPEIKAEEPENMEAAEEPIPIEETPGFSERSTRFELSAEPEGPESPGPWAWLYPEDTAGNSGGNPPQAVEAPAAAHNQKEVPEVPQSATLNLVAGCNSGQPRIKAVEPLAHQPAVAPEPVVGSAARRVILSMGGKGGVGKTSVMAGLAEWFEENRIPVTMLDLDIENKAIGSLAHFFAGRVPKINIHTPAGLDAFVDSLAEDAPVVLADMGAGAGRITHEWFDKMYPDVAQAGVAFTAIGVVTSDPASVESVLDWAAALQDRVDYVIVRNHLTEHGDFTYWEESDAAREFMKRFQPAILQLDYRLADLENAVRNHGVTLGQVANRTASAPELRKASLVMRAQSYRRRMFAEFDKIRELLLP